MKTDVLTVAILVLFVGVLVSSFSLSDMFSAEQEAPGPLQIGVATDD